MPAVRSKRVAYSVSFTQAQQCVAMKLAPSLNPILPPDVRFLAAVTCNFEIQGPNSVGIKGQNWGTWIRTRICTNGNLPPITRAWQDQRGGWISGDSIEAAESVLQCFGITMAEVFATFGEPEVGQKYTVKLADIIARIAPQFLQ